MRTPFMAVSLLLCLTTLIRPVFSAPPHQPLRLVNDKANVNDVLNFFHINYWKARLQGSHRVISAKIIHYERNAAGKFVEKSVLQSMTISTADPMTNPVVAVFWQEDGHVVNIELVLNDTRSGPGQVTDDPSISDMCLIGGNGNAIAKIGGEYILAAQYFKHNVCSDHKADMISYVALKVDTKQV